jgi:hypothetical protein
MENIGYNSYIHIIIKRGWNWIEILRKNDSSLLHYTNLDRHAKEPEKITGRTQKLMSFQMIPPVYRRFEKSQK